MPEVHLFSSVGSTNDVAGALAAEGAPSGTLVIAEEQLLGRGRAGRRWISPGELGLWLSMIVRPTSEELGALPLRIGAVVAEALDLAPDRPTQIKWPNDVLVGGRKVAGILCEASWSGGKLESAVAGIGINLLQNEADFPPELRGHATSLRLEVGDGISRYDIASRVVVGLRSQVVSVAADNWLQAVSRRDWLAGRRIRIVDPESGAESTRGVAAGIDADGALLLRTADGVTRVQSGTVQVEDGGPTE